MANSRLDRFCIRVQAAADEGSETLGVDDEVSRRSGIAAVVYFLDQVPEQLSR